MKKISGESKFLFGVLLLICLVVIFSGCSNSPLIAENAESFSVESLRVKATQIIREGLKDGDPQIRTEAVEVIATTKWVQLMPEVKSLLKDDYVPVRFAAALAVGDCEFHLAEKTVRKLLEKAPDTNTRMAAAYALKKLGDGESFEIVYKAMADSDQSVRANAALLLGKNGDERAIKILRDALEDKNSENKLKFQAAESIAMLGDERIYSKLWALLISAYADDRVIGIGAMGALGTEPARNALITMLDDKVLEVRLAAAEQLGMLGVAIGEPEVLDVFSENLIRGLDKRDIERVNMRTALAIGQIGTPGLVKFLPDLLKNKSKFVQIAAAKAVFQCISE